ncbi:MAG: low molecular weight protein arginine phosphatase [Chloroflexota bacterium]
MHSVLFVCSANICRSPMAQGLFLARLGGDIADWRVQSAGVWARDGYSAHANTLSILRDRGVDLSAHRSRQVNLEIMENFKLILTMESGHKEALQAAFPQYAERVYLLTEIVGQQFDIVDPVGGPFIEFEATAGEIDDLLGRGFDRLKELAREA